VAEIKKKKRRCSCIQAQLKKSGVKGVLASGAHVGAQNYKVEILKRAIYGVK
jgi:hypothetical protein